MSQAKMLPAVKAPQSIGRLVGVLLFIIFRIMYKTGMEIFITTKNINVYELAENISTNYYNYIHNYCNTVTGFIC